MINKDFNISLTLRNNLCTGCGVCEDVCPKKCIVIKKDNGENHPIVAHKLCLGEKCGRCLNVCPGVGLNFEQFAKEAFEDVSFIRRDKYIGHYVGLHSGYSLDESIRFHSASGGVVSQFLIYLLDKKIIDGAVVTAFDKDNVTPISYIATNKDEILKAKSSKYCPVSLNLVGNEIIKSTLSRFIIVGLPCHIQAFRKRATFDKRLKEKIFGYFSLYCSSGRSFYAQEYLLKYYKVQKKNIQYFAFRDEGCLGNLTIVHKENENIKSIRKISIPYTSYYGPLLRSFFKNYRCLTCIDHYGGLADVSFGDIHVSPYDRDKIGISSWITRSVFWEQLFHSAVEEGYIHMDKLDPDTLNNSQKTMLYPKERKARAMMNINSLIGRANPSYDKYLETPTIKDYISVIVCLCQMYIGRHRKLWWIIDLINKGK